MGSEQGHWSFTGSSPSCAPFRGEPSASASASGRPPPPATSRSVKDIVQSQEPHSPSTINPQGSMTGRRKRHIDVRFEQMRSYSEPPFQQSVYARPESVRAVLQPPQATAMAPKITQVPCRGPQNHLRITAEDDVSIVPPNIPDPRHDPHIPRSDQVSHHPVGDQPDASETSQQTSSSSQPRHGKNKLGMLKNPMALLAKRRSQQAVDTAHAESQNPPALKLPDDYDPRIRGKVVHDFSAPKPGSSQTAKQGQEMLEARRKAVKDKSPNCGERQHTPAFREQFDDGLQKSQDPAHRSPAFLQQMALQASQPQPDLSQLPAFARKLPPKFVSEGNLPSTDPGTKPKASLEVLLESPEKGQMTSLPSPPMSPPKARSATTSLSDRTVQDPGSPKRIKSNASRFSFDLAGVGSDAQEKLLEDKHRQKARQTHRQSTPSDEDVADHAQDVDFENMDGDAFEERIPGVNCDEDEEAIDAIRMPVLQRDMESFNLVSPNKSSFDSTASLVSTGVTSLDISKDMLAKSTGFAFSRSSPDLAYTNGGEASIPKDNSRPRSTPGQYTKTANPPTNLQRVIASEDNLAALPQRPIYLDDDMYFDDGMIDEMGDISDQGFDEDVFDDNGHGVYGLPLRDRTLKPSTDPQSVTGSDQAHLSRESTKSQTRKMTSPDRSLSSGGVSAEMRDAVTELNQSTRPIFSQPAGLTQDNLAAYNDSALSTAVNQAALDGAFERTPSIHRSEERRLDGNATQNHKLRLSRTSDHYLDFDGFDACMDDEEGMDDDAIVAAANAEALENDDDGFYGQEFGFYAKASGSSPAEYANGGYFGPRALEGLNRSHSGKADFQGPSLTPITERSEMSHRNSAISLAMLNPQFAGVNPEDVEAQIAMIKKMRRGAWGGSDASLQSSSNSQHSGSPINYMPQGVVFPSPLQASNSSANLQNMASSFHSFSSSNGHVSSNDSDPSPGEGSPTIKLGGWWNPPPSTGPPPPPTPPAAVEPSRPSSWGGKTPGHGKTNSGTGSVSYKEEGGKWVIEKRRLSETGEEILGRTIVEGGRI